MIKRALCLIFAFLTLVPLSAQASGKSDALMFTDVSPDSPFYEAIQWAVAYPSAENPITRGTTPTTFSPNAPCTRAQIITFIWRYQGSPTVSMGANPYDDTEGAYYEMAAAWANYNDYERGREMAGQRVFVGSTPCARLTAVVYLWKLDGRKRGNADYAKKFTDMTEKGASYSSDEELEAVGWAVRNGITNGTSETTFSPMRTCTRGQIVTFLYRYHQIA